MTVVYSVACSADGFHILRLQEISYLIKSTTMVANNNQERQRKWNKQLVRARSNRFCKHNQGRKLERTSVCNTEHLDLSMEVYTFT